MGTRAVHLTDQEYEVLKRFRAAKVRADARVAIENVLKSLEEMERFILLVQLLVELRPGDWDALMKLRDLTREGELPEEATDAGDVSTPADGG